MAEIASADAGFISIRLAARVAGLSQAEMDRIAVAFAKGRTEPWLGAVLEIRTGRVLGRRTREIRVASLPAWLREALETDRFRFLLSAEQIEPGAELQPADFVLLHRAGQAAFIDRAFFASAVTAFARGGPLTAATRERFDLMMDYFYGLGFRDAALPGVSPDYLDFLERSRLHLEMSDRYYAALLTELAGVDRPEHLDGSGFVKVGAHLMQLGLPWRLPERRFMDRRAVGMLHEACYQLGLTHEEHTANVFRIGGGALATRDLDFRGFNRVQSAYLAAGYVVRPPAPRVPGDPGFITQPQANLIWRLWCEWSRSTDLAALDRQLGGPGALAGLTASGAGYLIDEWLAPLLEVRLSANLEVA